MLADIRQRDFYSRRPLGGEEFEPLSFAEMNESTPSRSPSPRTSRVVRFLPSLSPPGHTSEMPIVVDDDIVPPTPEHSPSEPARAATPQRSPSLGEPSRGRVRERSPSIGAPSHVATVQRSPSLGEPSGTEVRGRSPSLGEPAPGVEAAPVAPPAVPAFIHVNKGPRGMWVADVESYFRVRFDKRYSQLRESATYHARNLSAWARGQAPQWVHVRGEIARGILYVSVVTLR